MTVECIGNTDGVAVDVIGRTALVDAVVLKQTGTAKAALLLSHTSEQVRYERKRGISSSLLQDLYSTMMEDFVEWLPVFVRNTMVHWWVNEGWQIYFRWDFETLLIYCESEDKMGE